MRLPIEQALANVMVFPSGRAMGVLTWKTAAGRTVLGVTTAEVSCEDETLALVLLRGTSAGGATGGNPPAPEFEATVMPDADVPECLIWDVYNRGVLSAQFEGEGRIQVVNNPCTVRLTAGNERAMKRGRS